MITNKIKAAAINPGAPSSSPTPVLGRAVEVGLGVKAVVGALELVLGVETVVGAPEVTVTNRCWAVWVSSALLVAIATSTVGDLLGARTMTGV